MARAPFLRTYTKTIPANGEIGPLNIGGTRFVCKESDGVFDLWMDDVGPNECEVGVGFRFVDEEEKASKFKTIRLVNNTATAITVKFWVGSAAVLDSRLNTLVDRTINVTVSSTADSYSKGSTGTLLNGATVSFSGLDSGRKRTWFSASNRNSTAVDTDILNVSGNNVAIGMDIDPKQSVAIPSGGIFYLTNNSGNSILYRVMEVFPL